MNLYGTTLLWAGAGGCGGDEESCHCGCSLKVGDPVTVNGLPGRGVVKKRSGRRLTVAFRNGQVEERDQHEVNKI